MVEQVYRDENDSLVNYIDPTERHGPEEEETLVAVLKALSGVISKIDNNAPIMVEQVCRDEYDSLVNYIDPTERKSPKEEGLLVAVLEALSGAISKIDIAFHASLLNNIFSLCIWNYCSHTRRAVLELIISLAAVPDKFLDGCLHMLVNNFSPPKRMREWVRHPRLADKKNIHSELYEALHRIADLVPLAPLMLKDIIDKRMPRSTDPKEVIVSFVECMLGLENDGIGEFIGNMLMAKVVELLMDLDVNISWEDILQEDNTKGIFDMELEDVEENTLEVTGAGSKPLEQTGNLKGNVFAKKLDSLMVIVCEHLQSRASTGHLVKVFDSLTESFRKIVMNAYKSKFAQFVVFYACSLDPDICGLNFAVMLMDIFISSTEDPISRMSSVAYLASYLSRAKFIPSSLVGSILERLVDWCFEYCQSRSHSERAAYPQAHRVFYSGCQAVMYILCFRMRSLMDVPHLRSLLLHLPLEHILCSPLNPLKVCLPTIVQEFLRQAKAACLWKSSSSFPFDDLIDSEFTKSFGGIERLDMFFPFDPYLLKESDRFMRPNFEYWSMVKTTYSNCNSEDEDEDLDGTEFEVNGGVPHDNSDLDSESDGEELEYCMNKMSITPKAAFHYPMVANLRNSSQMPARIQPSVSPKD